MAKRGVATVEGMRSMGRHRTPVRPMLIVLLLLPLGVGGLGPTPGVTISSAAGSAAGATGVHSLWAISCPSVTVCYAVGEQGTILATHDAGRTWQRQKSGTEGGLSMIDCPAVSVCFALTPGACGDSVHPPLLSTNDGGSIWTSKSLPGCPGNGFACPSVTTCYVRVLLYEFARTTDGGSSWQIRGAITADMGPRGSLACPSTTACYVGGDYAIGRSTDGAQTWRINYFEVPCSSEYICLEFVAIACPSQRICYAGGSDVVVATKDGGRTWRRHQVRGLGGIGALSCPTPTVCFAIGEPSGLTGRIATTTNGGDTWRVGRITRPYLFYAVACPSATVCYAAGYLGRLVGSVDGGRTWRDLIPAIFVSGTYRPRQPLHTYSRWFTATHPWHVALGVLIAPPGGPPTGPAGCTSAADIDMYVQNTAKKIVAGPIHGPLNSYSRYGTTVQVTGRLRLDVVSHCSSFSVRVDGVG